MHMYYINLILYNTHAAYALSKLGWRDMRQ